jgi:hypothetical protein
MAFRPMAILSEKQFYINSRHKIFNPLYRYWFISYNHTDMSKYDEFELLLTDFNKVEERLFLNDIREFALENPEVVTKTYTRILKSKKLNIQLKYLVLKSIGELKYKEFIPLTKDALYNEDKVRVIIEAVNALLAIGDLPAFKVVVDYINHHKDADYRETLEKIIRTVFSKNQLLYHYDLFYRKRAQVTALEKSSEYLINHLPDEYIKDILPALSSRHYNIRFELLRILKHRPNPIYYPNLYHYFKEHYQTVDESFFLILCETLIINAYHSKARSKIYQKLKEHVAFLHGHKKTLFCITLMKLNTSELIHFVASIYSDLNFQNKMLVLDNFNPPEQSHYIGFVRDLVKNEHNEVLLARIIKLLVTSHDFQYLFTTLDKESGVRKIKILNMILEEVALESIDISDYIRPYIIPIQANKVLHLALEYQLKHAANIDFDLILGIFLSGVTADIKTLIIRNVKKFERANQRKIMEAIFKDMTVVRALKKDFLFSLLGVLNDKVFDEELEEKILNRVLVMMEEAHFEEIVNFVYFFERYEINNYKDGQLIIDEMRLIQNTLLKSSNDNELVKILHVLVRKIEKTMMIKKLNQ